MSAIPITNYLCEGQRCTKSAAVPYKGKKLCVKCYRSQESDDNKAAKEPS